MDGKYGSFRGYRVQMTVAFFHELRKCAVSKLWWNCRSTRLSSFGCQYCPNWSWWYQWPRRAWQGGNRKFETLCRRQRWKSTGSGEDGFGEHCAWRKSARISGFRSLRQTGVYCSKQPHEVTNEYAHSIGVVDGDWALGMFDGGFDQNGHTTAPTVSSFVTVSCKARNEDWLRMSQVNFCYEGDVNTILREKVWEFEIVGFDTTGVPEDIFTHGWSYGRGSMRSEEQGGPWDG